MKNTIAYFILFSALSFSLVASEARSQVGVESPTIRVDTFCDHWHICATDVVPLASATLINDPNGDVYGKPGKVFSNVSFDAILDSNNTGEIVFNGTDNAVCFNVKINNPFDSGYAPIYIVDKNGYHVTPITELHRKETTITQSLEVAPNQTLVKVDTLQFGTVLSGNKVCSTLVYTNTAPKGTTPFTITDAHFKRGIDFTVTTMPSTPIILKGGDTLFVQVCFDHSASNPQTDTGMFYDSLMIATPCFNAPLLVIGKTATPLIYATDWDFGPVPIGMTSCHEVKVSNKGTLPFTLTKNWLLHNSTVFSIDPASALILPFVIEPRQTIQLAVCYSPEYLAPQDSTTIDWGTDIGEPYTGQIKSWSYLKGTPIKPGLIWDRTAEYFVPDSVLRIDSVTNRVNLINTGNATAKDINVSIQGKDSAEFSIVGDSLGYLPLQHFNLPANSTMWVDILFRPNLALPYPERYRDRIAKLLAVSHFEQFLADTISMDLIGTWTKSDVKLAALSQSFSIRPNPASGNSIIVSLPDGASGELSILDVLGRQVYQTEIKATENNIPIQNFPNGIFYAKMRSGNNVVLQKFEILR